MKELQQVIAENRALQEQARELNIRAGENVFKIFSREEWEQWLSERLNGARRVAEIVDFEKLCLPELEAELVNLVMEHNPDAIILDGEEVKLQYGKEYYGSCWVKATVSEKLARATKKETVVLPGGRKATKIICGDYSAENFSALVTKLEEGRINKAWEEARPTVETEWIRDVEKVYPLLPKLFATVEVTRKQNGAGEPIFGWISLYSDSDPDFKIKLRASLEEAQKETAMGLERLIWKALKEGTIIPQEEPYQYYTSGYYGGWKLTDLGQGLKNRFEAILTEAKAELSPANVVAKIDVAKAEAKKAREEVVGNFTRIQVRIVKVEADAKAQVEALDDNQGLVKVEIGQIEEGIKSAKDSLKSLSYKDADEFCELAESEIVRLPEMVKSRAEAKAEAEKARDEVRNRLGDISYDSGYLDAEKEQAANLLDAVNSYFRNCQFELVLKNVAEAKNFIAEVETRLVRKAESERILQAHIETAYATPFDGIAIFDLRFGQCSSLCSSDPLFPSLKDAFDKAEAETLRVVESRVNGKAICWLDVEFNSNYNELEFYLRRSDLLRDPANYLSADEKIDVVRLWNPPTGVEFKKFQLKAEQESYEREVENLRGDDEVMLLTMRSGKHPKTGETQWESGNKQIKYVVDRNSREMPEEEGEQWYCRKGWAMVDMPNFKLIVVHPILKKRDFQKEVVALEAEIHKGNGSKRTVPEVKKEVPADMLAALAAKFNRR